MKTADTRKLKICFLLIFTVLMIVLDVLCIVYLTKDNGIAIRCNKAITKDEKQVALTSLDISPEVQMEIDRIDLENAEAKEKIVKTYGNDVPIIVTIVVALDLMLAGIGSLLYRVVKNVLLKEKKRAVIAAFLLALFLGKQPLDGILQAIARTRFMDIRNMY